MPQPPSPLPNRRSTRLRGFDYATNAGYVVTVCTHQRRHLFGTIVQGQIQPSWVGTIVDQEWHRTARIRPGVLLDAFCLMPNHLHGIIILTRGDGRAGGSDRVGQFATPTQSVSAIVRGIKSAVTAAVKRERPEVGPVWQRGFHDRIIRNQIELERFQRYIADNAAQWDLDRYDAREVGGA